MILAGFILASLTLIAQVGSFYWLNAERKKLHKRLNVQRKMFLAEKEERGKEYRLALNQMADGFNELRAADKKTIEHISTVENWIVSSNEGFENRIASLEAKPSTQAKPAPPRTGTQAKREAEQRLANLTGVPQ